MAKIGCLKPFRGSYDNMKDIVLEDGEIAFTTNKRIYMGDGTNSISNLTPYINYGTTGISGIGTGSITSAISTLNSNLELQVLADLNDVSTTHVMFLSAYSSTTNSPGVGYWTVISMPYGSARIRQIAIGSADYKTTPEVKVRVSAYSSSGPDWGDWKTITIS